MTKESTSNDDSNNNNNGNGNGNNNGNNNIKEDQDGSTEFGIEECQMPKQLDRPEQKQHQQQQPVFSLCITRRRNIDIPQQRQRQRPPNSTTTSPTTETTTTTTVPNRCVICLQDYRPNEIIVLSDNPSCSHCYHRDCILEYLIPLLKFDGTNTVPSPSGDEESKSVGGAAAAPCPCCRLPFLLDTPRYRRGNMSYIGAD